MRTSHRVTVPSSLSFTTLVLKPNLSAFFWIPMSCYRRCTLFAISHVEQDNYLAVQGGTEIDRF